MVLGFATAGSYTMKTTALWYMIGVVAVIWICTMQTAMAAAAVVVAAIAFSSYRDRQQLVAKYSAVNAAKAKMGSMEKGMSMELVQEIWGRPKAIRMISGPQGNYFFCEFDTVTGSGRKVVYYAVFFEDVLQSFGEY
ncbi:MAG: hypothetical protein ACOH13_14230 [Flavobacteriales bacterium]